MKPSLGFCERLMRYYGRYFPYAGQWMTPLWKGIFDYHQTALHSALTGGEPEKLQSLLESREKLARGFYLSCGDVGDDKSLNSLLVVVASCLGLRPLPNPEQPFDSGPMDGESLVADIERSVGVSMRTSVPWMQANNEGFTNGIVRAFYSASAVKRFCGELNKAIEIGPGAGLIGVTLRAMGLKTYSAIDLPHGGVLTAWVVASTVGEDGVWFFGEPDLGDGNFLRVIPPCGIDSLEGGYDAVINTDSFPEIPHDMQDSYVAMIARTLNEKQGVFYSVNQESTTINQRSVYLCVSGSRFLRCRWRAPYPLRTGYLEELYGLY